MKMIKSKQRNSNSFSNDNEMKPDPGQDLEAPQWQETNVYRKHIYTAKLCIFPVSKIFTFLEKQNFVI